MIPCTPKISVLVISYNQENVIRRAMDSLIAQKEFLYEICINDDCSTDGTYAVLQEYHKEYPELVKPVRNNHNLFIFANIEETWKRPTGNLVYIMAGDDECPDGYFKHICEFVATNRLDCYNDKFVIYGDYVQVEPSGLHIKFQNNMILEHEPLKLKLRGLISNRSCCASISVVKQYVPVSNGRSYAPETTQDCELQLFSDKNYYIPHIGNIYYSSIGVSSLINKEEALERTILINNHLKTFLSSQNIIISKKDIHYRRFFVYLRKFQITHNLLDFIRMLSSYFHSLDFSLGTKTLLFDRVLRKIIKKIKIK